MKKNKSSSVVPHSFVFGVVVARVLSPLPVSNVIGSHACPIMIACGPFCALCQRALRVEPCSACSHLQTMDHTLADWGDDDIVDSLSQLDGIPSAVMIGALLVLLSPTPNLQPRPLHMSALASAMQWRCPHGVFVFHLQLKRCCRFLAHGLVEPVSPKQALCTLCTGSTQLGFAILRDGSLADLLVSC
jgi:hypothetical protein